MGLSGSCTHVPPRATPNQLAFRFGVLALERALLLFCLVLVGVCVCVSARVFVRVSVSVWVGVWVGACLRVWVLVLGPSIVSFTWQ